MRKPRDQASFFRQLVNILWYLASGNSKVGHMNMDDWNPLYQKLHGLQVFPPYSSVIFVMNFLSFFPHFSCVGSLCKLHSVELYYVRLRC